MEIEGTLIIEIFKSPKNNFRICKIQTNSENITVSGYFEGLEKNVPYIFEGDYVIHKKYGRQFEAKTVRINTSSKEGIINYFSSSIFSGIGIIMANKIYQLLGDNAVDKILDDKNCLLEIMNEKKASVIYNTLIKNEGVNKSIIELNNLGLTSKEAVKIIDYFKENAINIIKANPYELLNIEGIGFKKTDNIALSLGFEETCEYRIKAIIIGLMRRYCQQTGNCYMYKEELILEVMKFLSYRISSEKIDEIINILIIEEKIVYDEFYYLKEIYYAEVNFASKIKRMNNKIEVSSSTISSLINMAEARLMMEFDDQQKLAILNSLTNQISIITGGPGVGKTTIINAIIICLKALYKINLESNDLMLMAPTGKASRRMMETLNVKASTIHKALGYDESGDFAYNEDNMLDCRFIILDEASMLDIYLANALFKAISDDCRVIIVGDSNQLPSVNAGNVLKDLISSNIFSVSYLKHIYRQEEGSSIIKLSDMVLDGNIDDSIFNNDVEKIIVYDNIFENLSQSISKLLDQGYKFNDIVILAPLYKGYNGINEINRFIQNEYNKSKIFIEYNDIIFKENDRVIQLKNNVEKNISNGDTGIIKSIQGNKDIKMLVEIDGKSIEYSYEELSELNLAYCLSVHKAQGSEYKGVILLMFRNYSIMLKKKLLYTAVTRAKEKLVILCDNDSLDIASNNIDDERMTTLAQRLGMNKIMIDGFSFEIQKNDSITPYDFMNDDIF